MRKFINCIPSDNLSEDDKTRMKESVVKTFPDKKKRYSEITLLTAGNNVSSGFSNMRHRDCDFVCARLLSQCMSVLLTYRLFMEKKFNTNEYCFLNHIKKYSCVKKISLSTQPVDIESS